MKQNKYAVWGFIVACGIGFLDSLWLVGMHLNKSLQSGCSVNSLINCSAINHPTYSQWFSIPVSYFAVLVFSIIAVMFYLWQKSLESNRKEVIESFISIMIWLSVGAMLYFAAITVFIIKSFCLYCTIFYISSIAMFVFWKKLSSNTKSLSEKIQLTLASKYFFYSVLGAIFMLLFAKLFLFKEQHGITEKVNQIELSGVLSQRTLGQINAPITIVKYSDFQCPGCKQAGTLLKSIARESKGKIKLVYKFYPLDSKCNAKVPAGRGHLQACQAAVSSLCAAEQDQFWAYHDLVFANQHNLDSKVFEDYAKKLGLNMDSFKQCVQSSAAYDVVKNDVAEGERMNISHTPTIFINGREYQGRITRSGIQEVVDSLLQ
ncbi:MAG TPA: thioredoxin domain-containing protein [Oligoflexia bacterium]|nr:thioredoxin domain-containing protein [Oligoflexia bacterium]HMR25725.1 thioredoxin domain-containing protein [Oligoflexia bacterium]